MKVSNFYVNLGTPCSYSDVKIKHKLFPEIVKEVYGRENPSGYINEINEKKFNDILTSRYFFRYWIRSREHQSAYSSRKNFVVNHKTPYEALIEDYSIEVSSLDSKQEIFCLLQNKEKQSLVFLESEGEKTIYECVVIQK